MEILAKEIQEWCNHPVTETFFKALEEKIDEYTALLLSNSVDESMPGSLEQETIQYLVLKNRLKGLLVAGDLLSDYLVDVDEEGVATDE